MTHISRALLALIVLAAGCAQVPPRQEIPLPPAKPAPEAARYLETTFDTLPGWGQGPLAPSLRAFLTGCGRPPSLLVLTCELAAMVAPDDDAAARQFFESAFTPYAMISSDGGDSGLVTGYYEPVIDGTKSRDADNRFPIYGVPDDLITVDLASVNPDLRNIRSPLRGRLEGRRLVPYW